MISLKCDNCHEAVTFVAGALFPTQAIHYDYSDSDYVRGSRREPHIRVAAYTCEECKEYAQRAADEARKQALAMRAIGGPLR